MAIDLSNISDDALKQMYQSQQTIQSLETPAGTPDTSMITSPKGAQGSMQVMPATQGSPGFGVTPSNGTPQDTAREGRDYMAALTLKYGDPLHAAMAYNWGPGNMDKWLANGADMSKVPDETLKYAYGYAQKNPSAQQPQPPAQAPVSDVSKMTDDELKAAYQKQQSGGFLNNVKGAALQAANIGAGALEALPIGGAAAIGLGRRLIEGQPLDQALSKTVQQAGENFQTFSPENALNKLGVDTSGLQQTAGYQIPAKAMNFAFETVPGILGEGMARTGELEASMAPSEYTPEAGKQAKEALQFGMLAAPLAHLPSMLKGGAPVPEDLGKKLSTGDWDQPGTQVAPGEQAPLTPEVFQQAGAQSDIIRAQAAAEAEANLQPTIEDTLARQREQAQAEQQGIIEDVQAAQERESGQLNLFREPFAQRIADFNEMVQQGHEFTQGDMFNELSQRRSDQYYGEQGRSLTEEEFRQTMENLAGQEGTRFTMPEDPSEAYQKYLNTVSDEQGGLFDRPTIAKNFVETAARAAVDRFVNDHPIVKANMQKLESAQLVFDQARDSQTKMGAAGDLKRAQDTLVKSQENISKFYQGDKRFGMYEKDGVIHMNSGIPLPDWIKNGLLKLLQGLHGVAVELTDRAFQKFRNINSASKIIQAGIRQAANEKRATPVDVKVNEKPVDFLKKSPAGFGEGLKAFIPDDRSYDEAKPELAAAHDMDSNWVTRNVSSQGGIWASALSKNPVVKWAYTHIQNALKEADDTSRRLLTNNDDGLRGLIQKMNSREKGEIHARMDMDEGQQLRSDNELRQMGFNDKQRAYYKRFHEVMNEVYDRFNQAMQNAGMPPVDKRVAYMTSRFMGDFRSLVYEKGTTRPVGFIGANTRFHVDGIKARLEEQFPGKYDFEKTTLNKGSGKAGPDMFQGYLNVLNHFQLNDPEMKAIMDTYREYFTNNAAKAMGALQHAKDKSGVFGAEGRKSWETQEKNAVEGMKSQLTYADHMIKWSAMQEAASKVKQMMEDPDINQPNAKSYVKDYLANAMGQSTSKFAQGLSDLLDGVAKRTGIGPSILRGLNSGQKSALLQLWLGFFRLPHAMLTMTQFAQSNPAMAEFIRTQGGGNFWAHSMKGMGTTMQIALKQLNPNHELSGFDKQIWDYNQKNGVFSANLTNHLTDVNSSKAGRAFRHIMEANITYPEAAIRSSTFSIWAHTLKDTGMSTKDALGTAENLTRAALVDYRPSERPLVFGKMGLMGDIASTLTRFKMNQISQHQMFAKEAVGGKNFTPMAALLTSSIAFAGISGLMGFNYADQLYQMFTEHLLGKPDTLKAVMLRNLPDWANYGMFAQLGINMQGSFSNADTLPDNPLATLFPTGNTVASMAKSLGEAVYYHDDTSMKKLMYNFSPTSVKGIEENQMFSKDVGNGNKLFINPNTEKAQTVRTPTEQAIRNAAFRPIAETRENDVIQSSKDISTMYSNLRERDLKRIDHQFAQGIVSPSDLAKFREDWVTHRGDASAAGEIENYMKNQRLTEAQRSALAGAQGNIGAKYTLQDIFKMGGTR